MTATRRAAPLIQQSASSVLTLPAVPAAPVVPGPSKMFVETGDVTNFVLSQLPSPRDTLAILHGLSEELPRSAWGLAGLSPQQLATEMRRQSFQSVNHVGAPTANWPREFLKDALNVIMDRSIPDVPEVLAKRARTQRDYMEQHAALVERLKRACEDYARRADKVGARYNALLRKTGLSQDLCCRVMSLLTLVANDKTGPDTYCMRCRTWAPLFKYIVHVANSDVHVRAAQ